MFPTDLTPISTSPWDERPEELPLDKEEVRTALWHSQGNISRAAELLKITSLRLRNFVKSSPYLCKDQDEARERVGDLAEVVVVQALQDVGDPGRQDSMARFVLAGQIGKARGYGNQNGSGKTGKISIGPMVIEWGSNDPEEQPGDNAKVINQ